MSVDMSKVKVGTRVQYRNGEEVVVTSVEHSCDGFPYCVNNGKWNELNGSCLDVTQPEYDIVEIIYDDAKPQMPTPEQPVKPARKRSAPLYNELLTERELLKIENHNMKVQLDNLKNGTLFGVLTWWFHNRKGEWK